MGTFTRVPGGTLWPNDDDALFHLTQDGHRHPHSEAAHLVLTLIVGTNDFNLFARLFNLAADLTVIDYIETSERAHLVEHSGNKHHVLRGNLRDKNSLAWLFSIIRSVVQVV